MNGLTLRWLILTVAVMASAYMVDGIHVKGFFSALLAAAVLGVLNALLRPILIILTLPLTVLTLGFFLLVINALLLLMASGVIGGFEVTGFWAAVWGSVIISLVSGALNWFIGGRGKVEVIDLKHRRRNGQDYWE